MVAPGSERTKHLLRQAGRRRRRVLANGFFLFADHLEQAIQRLLGDVVFDVGVFRIHYAHGRRLSGERVVLLGQANLVGGLLDDGQEFGADLFATGLVQLLGGRIVAAAEDALGVFHGHFLHGIDQDWLGLGHGAFRRLVHAGFQFIDLVTHAEPVSYTHLTLPTIYSV